MPASAEIRVLCALYFFLSIWTNCDFISDLPHAIKPEDPEIRSSSIGFLLYLCKGRS